MDDSRVGGLEMRPCGQAGKVGRYSGWPRSVTPHVSSPGFLEMYQTYLSWEAKR